MDHVEVASRVTRPHAEGQRGADWQPAPRIALIGLIPLFIGLALLIIYFLTRKEETLAPEMTSVKEGEIFGD